MDTIRAFLASKLKEFRKAANMNVDQVGELIGRSGKTVSAWEVGRGQPDADQLIALCNLYKVKISDFYPPDFSMEELAPLKTNEEILIGFYRNADDEGQRQIIDNAEFVAARHPRDKGDVEEPGELRA